MKSTKTPCYRLHFLPSAFFRFSLNADFLRIRFVLLFPVGHSATFKSQVLKSRKPLLQQQQQQQQQECLSFRDSFPARTAKW